MPPDSSREEIVHYLHAAKSKVDDAVQASELKVKPEAEVNGMLRDAAGAACKALDDLSKEEAHWQRVSQGSKRGKSVIVTAIKEIILGREKSGERHFDKVCLPVTAECLVKFGFKPPEEAKEVVATACRTCDALNAATYDFSAAAERARAAIKALADATCDLARKLRDKAEDAEWWRARRGNVVGCLKEIGKALIAAVIGAAVAAAQLTAPNGPPMSPAGNSAVEIMAVNYVEETAKEAAQALHAQQSASDAQGKGDDVSPNEMEAD